MRPCLLVLLGTGSYWEEFNAYWRKARKKKKTNTCEVTLNKELGVYQPEMRWDVIIVFIYKDLLQN